jgi:hypothetical protein
MSATRSGLLVLVVSLISFFVSFIVSEMLSAEMRRHGVKLSDIFLKNVLRPWLGPNGIHLFPTFQSQYELDPEKSELIYTRQTLKSVWKLYNINPNAFFIEWSNYDQNGDCWPTQEDGSFEVLGEKSHAAIAVTNIMTSSARARSDQSFDTIVCTVLPYDFYVGAYDKNGQISFDCPRMGCPTSMYHNFDGKWRRIFNFYGCTRLFLLETNQNGVRDIFCSAFGNIIWRWDGSKYS